MKTLTQCLNLYGFSSECLFKCHLRSHIGEKAFAHCLHWNGFSPVCILKCSIRWIFTKKPCHINCIAKVLPQDVYTCASQKYTKWNKINIHKTSSNAREWPCLWYIFSTECVSIFVRSLFLEKIWQNAWIYIVSLQNVFSNVG